LPFCKTDAEAVSGTFKEYQNRSGSTVTSLGSEKVTRAELLAALQKSIASIPDDSNSDFLFYVSSHGATVPKDGRTVGVLVTSDYVSPAAGKDYSPEANSGLAWYEVINEFKAAIKKGKVGRVVLLLDTCYSGLAATLGSTDLPIAIFTSSRANQQSTSSDAKMSDFTKAVVQSLRSHSEKGALPLYRIGTKVRDAMRGKAAQLPYFYPGFPGTDEIELLRAIE
jgi:uncharacterized caspase-like protein